jgi:hypothetical protein
MRDVVPNDSAVCHDERHVLQWLDAGEWIAAHGNASKRSAIVRTE